MKGSNLKYFAIGAIIAAGLGVAVTLPAPFAAQEALSAAKLNQYFTAIKTAIDALEANGSVSEARIADNAVTTNKIAAGAVGNTDIAGDAVTTEKIAAGAVGNADLANNAVNSAKIEDGTVSNADLQATAVSAAKTIDEPGAAQANSNVTISSTSETLLFSQSMSVPAGFVMVMASGELCIAHATGTESKYVFGVSINQNVLGIDQKRTIQIPATALPGTYCYPVSSQKIFSVQSGQVFVEAVGQRVSGPNATGRFTLSAISIASSYGTVSN